MKGEISPEVYEEWNRETGGKKLPERVGKKSTKKRAKSVRRARPVKRAKARRGKKSAKR